MRIALTMRVTEAPRYHEPRDSISHDWIRTLTEWGVTPLLIPNRLGTTESYLDGLAADLFVLTGGDDLGITPERDKTEIAVLDYALRRDRPVLGVCRGLQLINQHFGGRATALEGHVATMHDVALRGPFAALYGERVTVNSFHRWGIRAPDLAAGLITGGVDEQQNVEATYHEKLKVAAVMWHPERPGAPPADAELLRGLVAGRGFWS